MQNFKMLLNSVLFPLSSLWLNGEEKQQLDHFECSVALSSVFLMAPRHIEIKKLRVEHFKKRIKSFHLGQAHFTQIIFFARSECQPRS